MKKNILDTLLCLCALILGATSCQDDWLTGNMASGYGTIHATVDFRPMNAALTGKSRAAGDAIKDISSLYVLLYDYETKALVRSQEIAAGDYNLEEMGRTDADAENGETAESQTTRATFSVNDIAFGRYHMYVVANIPDFLTKYSGYFQTIDGLKSIPLTWNNDTARVAENGQMLGFFTGKTANQPEEAPLVINNKSMQLHAWLRRAASKVTVAYDGKALKEGVFVYVKSVQIKDIPSQCYLGKENNVGGEGYTLAVPSGNTDKEISQAMPDGQLIKYYEGETEPTEFNQAYTGPCITAGNPQYGSHDEKAPALFFYENMQGEGKDKRQDADTDSILDAPGLPDDPAYVLKDGKPYGTYIEVKAHYISLNTEKIGSGDIVYRFMLGQNVFTDYDAKRNCHYKLTLKFKNFANDADWHIEYVEPDPGVVTVDPYYISYLYNHSLMYPLKINTGGYQIESITATIEDNRWAPYKADGELDYYKEMDLEGQNCWNGFLSLHKTVDLNIEGSGKPFTSESNKSKYEEEPKRGRRTYTDFSVGEHSTSGSKADDVYRVEKHATEENTYNVYLPMYTRAKQLIKETGYTGNNPYEAHRRKAVVKFVTKLKGMDQSFENDVTIYQVPRVVNPKGIFRKAGSKKPFHVVLKTLPHENAENYLSFKSEGPWRAYVMKQTNGTGINLREQRGVSSLKKDTIYGKTGSEIDFHIDFNEGADNASENRYAIILVEYHNYTCYHLIFVRQGDKPDNLIDGGALWYAENMKTRDQLADSPLDEGSLFKLTNWDDPIDALNNKNSKTVWTDVVPGDFKSPSADGFIIAGKKEGDVGYKKTWSQITTKIENPWTPVEFEDPNEAMAVAKWEDYEALYNNKSVEQGYGVLYGDDADGVASHINDAYGHDYLHQHVGRGMRGCFVYNKDTGKNLFFPIGASGYGHRKDTEGGILRYAAGQTGYFTEGPVPVKPTDGIFTYPNGVKDVPLFYDIYMRPGAIYWYKAQGGNIPNGPYVGWDFNYFTLDFFPIGSYSTGKRYDACFVRCVKK